MAPHCAHEAWPPASLLGRLNPTDRKALLAMGTQVRYAAQQALLRQGERGDHTVLLLEGCVRVVVTDRVSGEEVLLAVRVVGDLVGEMAVFDGGPRSATVVAATAVTARRLGRTQFLTFLDSSPAVARVAAAMVSERLRWANRRRADFVASSASVRVGRVLAEVARAYGEVEPAGLRLDVSLTQRDLGCLAGVKLAAVEKALRKFEESGLIERRRRQILVRNWIALCDVAHLTPVDPY